MKNSFTKRIKIYDDVECLNLVLFHISVTTDMNIDTEIEKFAKDKKIEIDTLKIREEYQKRLLR
jgi:two-component system phosphate regulon sensor histidine kinase PhoR